jgi:hypothetical protein
VNGSQIHSNNQQPRRKGLGRSVQRSEISFEIISEIIEDIQTNLPFPHQTIKNHNLSKSIGVDHLTTDNASLSIGFQQFLTSVQPIMLTNTPNGITIFR